MIQYKDNVITLVGYANVQRLTHQERIHHQEGI
jgi:hypothetical protein